MTDFLFVWLPFLAAIIAAAFGVCLMFLGTRTYINAVLLRRWGVIDKAIVTKRYREKKETRRDNSIITQTHYTNFVDYVFQREATSYEIKRRLPTNELWESLSVGDEVEIIYLPRNPNNSQLAEYYVNAGKIGGIIQMGFGAIVTTSCLTYLISGLLTASYPISKTIAGDDWIKAQAVVLWITKPDDPFLRIMQPKSRMVHLEVGDDDGGRDYVGQTDVFLGANEFPEVRVGDVMDVLHHPIDKNYATLRTLE